MFGYHIDSRYDSSTSALKALHWLPIHLQIRYKTLTLVFRCIHGLAPQYLRDLIKPASVSRPGLRSQDRDCIMKVPFTKYRRFADRAFSVQGPKLWNSLPNYLRLAENLDSFKSQLKTFLFGLY